MTVAQDPRASRINPFWRGQLFLFDKPPDKNWSHQQGLRLLLVFLFMEGIARPLVGIGARSLNVADRSWWPLAQMSLLTALACWLVVSFVKTSLSTLGLRAWSRWSKTEKFYFLQTIPIAVIVFSLINLDGLKALWAQPNLGEVALFIFVPQMIWGMYQEIVYRAFLQSELVRRWGAVRGIAASNLIFTLGPLHAYHFLAARTNPSHLWIFAGIFAIRRTDRLQPDP